jgi:hypothetical protein
MIRMIMLRRMRWEEPVARMGEKRKSYRILVAKPEGKRPLERPRRRWVDNIIMDLSETEWDVMDSIDLAQDREQWRACDSPNLLLVLFSYFGRGTGLLAGPIY